MLKRIDTFSKNIVVVFTGTSIVNLLNLLYQLLIAHKLSPADFAAFNSLLSIFLLVASPLATIQVGVIKYFSEYNAHDSSIKARQLLSDLCRKILIVSIALFCIFSVASGALINLLKIPSLLCGYILAGLIASACCLSVFTGGIQGLELFNWLSFGSVAIGIVKLGLASIFIFLGFNIAGALGALLAANLVNILIFYFPLSDFLNLKVASEERPDYKSFIYYLLPVAVSNFCFIALVSIDMVMVKYYFSPADSGIYSLAQMIGKIFLFFPGAISLVMFPKVSGLNAKNMDTVSTLKKSLLYGVSLCLLALVFYNLFPALVLKVLTGKDYPESIYLGRLFGISMSLFALIYIFGSYFLSIRDTRFLKYVALFTILQIAAIALFHSSLRQVQFIMCLNSSVIFLILLSLARVRVRHEKY